MRKTRPTKNEVVVERSSNIRNFTYRAFIHKRTGRLICITAGCRRWKNFKFAKRHYGMFVWNAPESAKVNPSWDFPEGIPTVGALSNGTYASYLMRSESRALLAELESDVKRRQFRIRRRSR